MMSGYRVGLALPEVLIRPMREQDWQRAIELIHHSIRTLNPQDYGPDQIKIITEMYTLKEVSSWTIAFVADSGGQLVGVIGGVRLGWMWDRIHGLFVHPNSIRQKIGSRLLREFERVSRADHRIKMIKISASLTALDFYLSHGYQILSHRDNPVATVSLYKVLTGEKIDVGISLVMVGIAAFLLLMFLLLSL